MEGVTLGGLEGAAVRVRVRVTLGGLEGAAVRIRVRVTLGGLEGAAVLAEGDGVGEGADEGACLREDLGDTCEIHRGSDACT